MLPLSLLSLDSHLTVFEAFRKLFVQTMSTVAFDPCFRAVSGLFQGCAFGLVRYMALACYTSGIHHSWLQRKRFAPSYSFKLDLFPKTDSVSFPWPESNLLPLLPILKFSVEELFSSRNFVYMIYRVSEITLLLSVISWTFWVPGHVHFPAVPIAFVTLRGKIKGQDGKTNLRYFQPESLPSCAFCMHIQE